MSESVICAVERTEKPNQVRKQGFIPGVIYGKGVPSTSIKLEKKAFKRMLQGHPTNSRVQLKLGNEEKTCIIKAIQRDPIKGEILHVELQTIHSEDKIRLKVPVVFLEKEKLGTKQLLLQEFVPEVEVLGKAADMPEVININVGDMNIGDKITAKDIQLGNNLKILNDENEVLAVVTPIKAEVEEKTETEEAG